MMESKDFHLSTALFRYLTERRNALLQVLSAAAERSAVNNYSNAWMQPVYRL